jgi:hypothetical protein
MADHAMGLVHALGSKIATNQCVKQRRREHEGRIVPNTSRLPSIPGPVFRDRPCKYMGWDPATSVLEIYYEF